MKRRIRAALIAVWLWLNWTAIQRRWADASDEERDGLRYWATLLIIVFLLVVWNAAAK